MCVCVRVFARAEVFHADSYSGFILIGYQQDNLTLELQACGEGGIAQCVDFLEDDQQVQRGRDGEGISLTLFFSSNTSCCD